MDVDGCAARHGTLVGCERAALVADLALGAQVGQGLEGLRLHTIAALVITTVVASSPVGIAVWHMLRMLHGTART